MNATEIKLAYERWQGANAEWVEATLDLGKQLHEARRKYSSNEEFSIWLEKNDVKLNAHDRAVLVGMGANPERVRPFLENTERRSLRLIWKDLEKSLGSAAKTNSSASKKKRKKGQGRRVEERKFARRLLATIRHKRKEVRDVKITRKWRPEAVNKLELHNLLDEIERWLDDFINHRAVSLDAALQDAERKLDEGVSYVFEEDERRTREFDA